MDLPMSNELLELLPYLSQPERAELDRLLATTEVLWEPFPDSPQQQAYESQADIIGYGGAAGGGKTDTLLGKAFTQFHNAAIYRRHYTDLTDMVKRGNEILAGKASFVWGVKREWTLSDRSIVLSAVQYDSDLQKFRGRARDFIGIDEATEFPESYVRFLMGWLRTDKQGHHTQVVLTFNPPTTPEGEWVLQFFAPWLDPNAPNPAKPGELRWYIRYKDEDIEVPDSTPVEIEGIEYAPKSRTFIPARIEHNPVLMLTDYRSQLNSLPEPLRSQLLKGDFTIRGKDDAYQVIPTLWVLEAQRRFEEGQAPDVVCRSIGVDVARGGDDNNVIAKLRGVWFDPLIVIPGSQTPNGDAGAEEIRKVYEEGANVYIDVIGIGSSVYDSARKMEFAGRVWAINNGASPTPGARDKSRMYEFANLRAETYWKLREALDPDSGENICLPPDRDLRVELCAPRFKAVGGKYQIEPKDEIKKRIGRSPDRADAVVMAWHGAGKSNWWELPPVF